MVRLENDVLKLEPQFQIRLCDSRALKKYDTEYTPGESQKRKENVVIFENGTNSMSFQLPLPQGVSTADLYFTPEIVNDTTVLMKLPVAEGAYWGIEYTRLRVKAMLWECEWFRKTWLAWWKATTATLAWNGVRSLCAGRKGRCLRNATRTLL